MMHVCLDIYCKEQCLMMKTLSLSLLVGKQFTRFLILNRSSLILAKYNFASFLSKSEIGFFVHFNVNSTSEILVSNPLTSLLAIMVRVELWC